MLNSHINSRVYHTLTSTYSDYIEGHHIYSAVAHLFGDLTCQSQYDIIGKIGYSWYQHAHQEACETTEKLLSYDSVWSKKAGLDFLKISLQYGESEFLKEFYEVETIIQSIKISGFLQFRYIFGLLLLTATVRKGEKFLQRYCQDWIESRKAHWKHADSLFLLSNGKIQFIKMSIRFFNVSYIYRLGKTVTFSKCWTDTFI